MPFNILIRLPNWLGDAIMASFAMEILYQNYPNANFYLVGNKTTLTLYKNKPNTTCIVDSSKNAKSRILYLKKLANSLPMANLAITFQNNLLSALFLFFNKAKIRIGYKNEMRSIFLTKSLKKQKNMHESLRYAMLIESLIPNHKITPKLYLQKPKTQITLPLNLKNKKLFGINAGAAFGDAKRWNEAYFAKIICAMQERDYGILLFGVESENHINENILNLLSNKKNILNLSGKTNLEELMAYFLKLDFLLTNDSGPMHIAAAFSIPTLVLFGPTDSSETSPFCAKKSHIISLRTLDRELDCMPCKKRSCPIKDSKKNHACMNLLTAEIVLTKILEILSNNAIKS